MSYGSIFWNGIKWWEIHLKHTNRMLNLSTGITFVLSLLACCSSCVDSLCASPRSSSCLFRKLICCWVLSLLLSWRIQWTHKWWRQKAEKQSRNVVKNLPRSANRGRGSCEIRHTFVWNQYLGINWIVTGTLNPAEVKFTSGRMAVVSQQLLVFVRISASFGSSKGKTDVETNTQTPCRDWPKNRGISKATEPWDSMPSAERRLDEDMGHSNSNCSSKYLEKWWRREITVSLSDRRQKVNDLDDLETLRPVIHKIVIVVPCKPGRNTDWNSRDEVLYNLLFPFLYLLQNCHMRVRWVHRERYRQLWLFFMIAIMVASSARSIMSSWLDDVRLWPTVTDKGLY